MPDIEKMSLQYKTKEITDKLEKGIIELFDDDKFKNFKLKFTTRKKRSTILILVILCWYFLNASTKVMVSMFPKYFCNVSDFSCITANYFRIAKFRISNCS